MQTLLIYLKDASLDGTELDTPTPLAEWVLVDSGGLPHSQGRDSLASIAEHATRNRVIVIVPSENVLITHITTQARKPQQLAKAVPFALEEDLAEDIEHIHFAVGPRIGGDDYAVCAVSHEQMQTWLAALHEASITPRSMIPDVFALPYQDGDWSLLLQNDRAVLRTGQYEGTAIEPDNLLAILAATSNEIEQSPGTLTIFRCESEHQESRLPELPFEYTQSTDCPPSLFAMGINEKISINLLQGQYGRQDDTLKKLKPWRLAAALLAVWLVVTVAAGVMNNLRLEKEDQALQSRLSQIYRSTFPSAQDNLHPDTQRIQMEQRLSELQGSQSGEKKEENFMTFLHSGGKAVKASPNVDIQTITFRGSSLEMSLQSNNWQSLETVQKSIEESGYSAAIGAADTRGKTVSAQLLIKGSDS